jgi:hypothetical protein
MEWQKPLINLALNMYKERQNILNFMENSKKLLLVHRTMATVTLSEPVNIMLTPQFYTLKKEILPVQYAYQAKKLAHSLFDGLLDVEGTYDFLVYKENEYWTFIAYDVEMIIAFLKTKGFNQGDVSKIFFAQQSVDKFTSTYRLGESDALVVIDETVVIVPSIALGSQTESPLHFDRAFTPSKGVSLEDVTASVFTMKQTVFFSLIFILFAVMYFIEGVRYGGGSQSTEKELQALYVDHPSLQSTYTREGIVTKYRNIDKIERAKRDAVKKLSAMIFKGVTLTAIYVDHKKVKANFSCTNKKIAQRVEILGKKAEFKVSKIKGSFDLYMEGTL